jgi:hypothetical protein
MKVLINPRPAAPLPQPLPADLTLIRQPTPRTGLTISVFVGMLIPFIPCMLLSLQSTASSRAGVGQDETVPVWIVFPVLIVCIVVHEFLHLICHPDGGRSDQSIVLIWPRRFQFGVYYAGFMKRSRWLVMRLAPLAGLTLIPTLLLLLAYPSELSFFWRQFVVLVILVNGLGAGSDVVASVIVARQVPAQGKIGTWNGRACWRAAA